jgi:hypothetical protein
MVRAHPGRPRALRVSHRGSAAVCAALLYGRARRLTAQTGGFRRVAEDEEEEGESMYDRQRRRRQGGSGGHRSRGDRHGAGGEGRPRGQRSARVAPQQSAGAYQDAQGGFSVQGP